VARRRRRKSQSVAAGSVLGTYLRPVVRTGKRFTHFAWRLHMKTWVLLATVFLSTVSTGFAQQPAWTQVNPATSPPFGYYSGMVYDSARSQVVLFGGIDSSVVSGPPYNYSDETWTWDGSKWTKQSPTHTPPARCCFGMAYDAARGQAVIFGGASPTGFLTDTWVWDGVDWTQKADGPGPRLHTAMTYDDARQQVLLFGGGDGSPTPYGDTWVWDGATWTQKFPATTPGPRSNFRMTYDAARSQVVFFGGWNGSTPVDETWTWDGSLVTYSRAAPGTP
jgi:hypothetical protein